MEKWKKVTEIMRLTILKVSEREGVAMQAISVSCRGHLIGLVSKIQGEGAAGETKAHGDYRGK